MREDDFIGQQFTWFTGVVENITDPMKLNRVKVRCIGFHTQDTKVVSTNDLPWATVVMPVTNASIKGNGGNHHLEVGSWVVGFFRDGPSAQDPMVLGSVATQTDGEQDIPTESSTTNKVYKSKSGHLIEIDNGATPPLLYQPEIRVTHSSGSKITMNHDGSISIVATNIKLNA
jgi:hypothetical protein